MSENDLEFCQADPSLAQMLYEWRQDPVMLQFNPLAASSVEKLRERLQKSSCDLGEFEKAESFFWFLRSNGQYIGNINCQNINKQMLTLEVGYNIVSSSRTKGLATLALTKLSHRVFEKTPIRKIIAYVHEENSASIKVLNKAGFTKEGLLREHYLINGHPVNEAIFGLLRRDLKP